ncbi:MAG: hypothetical protein R3A47_01895 [Polyangiales bacterium]
MLRSRLSLAVIVLFTLCAFGCDNSSSTESTEESATDYGVGPWDEGVAVPYQEQPPGNPTEGFHALVEKGYVSCGVPAWVFGLVPKDFTEMFSRDPLTDKDGRKLRSGSNTNLPYNWTSHMITEQGVDLEVVSPNCLQCHASYFNGELIIGLGNVWTDYTEDFTGGAGEFLIYILKQLFYFPGKDSVLKLLERQQGIAAQMIVPVVGSNPAVATAVALASHRDPYTLEWLDEPWTPLNPIQLAIDTPPWWRTHKKSTQFYNGMSRGDHKGTMTLVSMFCTDSNEEAEETLSYFDDVHAYIRSIEPPKYPFAIDQEEAAVGEKIYVANCAGCHGTYGATDDEETFPNLMIPLDVLGTDETMAVEGTDNLKDWFGKTAYAQSGDTQIVFDVPFRGYAVPPLDAIWATPPFLHNGSVPNLYMLLNSRARPKYWKKEKWTNPRVDSMNFDEENIGWPYEEVEYGQDTAPANEKKYIFDTTLKGHSNTGHTFGDALTDKQRLQLIEYMKTL